VQARIVLDGREVGVDLSRPVDLAFLGLPRVSVQLAAATRPSATITELACVPDRVPDGAYVLDLRVLALTRDAVPSGPLPYSLTGPAA
jgi:hypothetical protein